MQEKKAALILFVSLVLGAFCAGCSSDHGLHNASYQIQTRCPDVWNPNPTQEISLKMEIRR